MRVVMAVGISKVKLKTVDFQFVALVIDNSLPWD